MVRPLNFVSNLTWFRTLHFSHTVIMVSYSQFLDTHCTNLQNDWYLQIFDTLILFYATQIMKYCKMVPSSKFFDTLQNIYHGHSEICFSTCGAVFLNENFAEHALSVPPNLQIFWNLTSKNVRYLIGSNVSNLENCQKLLNHSTLLFRVQGSSLVI